MNTSKDRSPMRRRTARDGIDAELQKTLRAKLDAREYEAVMAAIGGGNSADDEPDEETDYAKQQFSAANPRDDDDEDFGQFRDKPGDDSVVGKDNGALAEKIMSFVGPHLTDEDRDGLQDLLDRLMGSEDDTAEDNPPPFPGKPRVGGNPMSLSTKPTINPAQDARVVRYASKVRDEARKSFDARFPEAARLGLGEPQRQYRDGMPVHDPRLLGGSAPTPRRSAAMDSAASLRSAKSFAERFPGAASIRVEG